MYISSPNSPPLMGSSKYTYAIVTRETECGFEGNQDIYGIGIRVGIYAQILAVWFANYFLVSEAQVLRDGVTIFSVALFVVAAIYAAAPSEVHAVEIFVLLQILAYACVMGVKSKSSFTALNFKSTLMRKMLNDAINLGMVCLHIWFWWTGVDKAKETPCGTYIMYVVKTDIFGWVRIVMKILSTYILISTIYWLLDSSSRPWMLMRLAKRRRKFNAALLEWEKYNTQKNIDSQCYSTIEESAFGIDHRSDTQSNHSSHPSEHEEQQLSRQHTLSPTTNDTPEDLELGPQRNAYPTQGPPPDLEILEQVYEAEKYIVHSISASPYSAWENKKPITPFSFFRTVSAPRTLPTTGSTPRSRQHEVSSLSWAQCHYEIWKRFFTFRFSRRAFVVYSHICQSRQFNTFDIPYQIHAALLYPQSTSSKDAPSWLAVSLASTLMVTHQHAPKRVSLGWYHAIFDFAVHVILILQVELTLAWNQVSGLTELWTNVGQLIPFIIGVGGLCLVSARWVVKWWVKKNEKPPGEGNEITSCRAGRDNAVVQKEEEDDTREELFGLDIEVRERYQKWKASCSEG
ncbi:hypothetical protein BU24DRAFT_467819 [Aaosphaeria arxii CBS 175.79]|uniref:Uncharacterized protein n=1 Tax=Aaosphaeria arxii CBS 175.79 TaxID=1450172 RepID=A0A6A5X936_9PLEO|nr:uncharacterized protein BU24DRAFT_467819 [Aaosphaeria arxii CBS 175.79]KAF2009441.1 hypothetical protein BU24DRAFT_467819 [Aaosphaeria arxii CBS 175.79]